MKTHVDRCSRRALIRHDTKVSNAFCVSFPSFSQAYSETSIVYRSVRIRFEGKLRSSISWIIRIFPANCACNIRRRLTCNSIVTRSSNRTILLLYLFPRGRRVIYFVIRRIKLLEISNSAVSELFSIAGRNCEGKVAERQRRNGTQRRNCERKCNSICYRCIVFIFKLKMEFLFHYLQ